MTLMLLCVTAAAETAVWQDHARAFKKTMSFSVTRTALVILVLPEDNQLASGRWVLHYQIEQTSGNVSPYLVINDNPNALYYLHDGRSSITIKAGWLQPGRNVFIFRDNTSTGDVIFLYRLDLQPAP